MRGLTPFAIFSLYFVLFKVTTRIRSHDVPLKRHSFYTTVSISSSNSSQLPIVAFGSMRPLSFLSGLYHTENRPALFAPAISISKLSPTNQVVELSIPSFATAVSKMRGWGFHQEIQ